MAGYEVFSAFYDALTENVEYAAWAEYILALFDRFSGKKPKTVLDLACGTGSLTEQLLKRGLRVIGVDGSAEMLASAQQKTAPFGKKVLLLCQDMCALELGGTVDGAVCMLDSFSHLTTTAAVKAALCGVADSLPVGGVLIFDEESQDVHCGGSGCGCSASVLAAHILPSMRKGIWNRVLFAATGALMSATSAQQGDSIPGICHAVAIENPV